MHISRRALILFSAIAAASATLKAKSCPEPDQRTPTDPEPMNAFADAYNRYAETLRGGVIDLKQWARVSDRWKKMTRD